MLLVDKSQVAAAFGRAVHTYDQQAVLQREIADELIQNILQESMFNGKTLDAGCGTGYISERLKNAGFRNITALDLSASMLQQAMYNQVAHDYRQGDIEQLPWDNDYFDCVTSSLAIQWCHSFERALAELCRVLKPKGVLHVATLIQPTLCELEHAWQTIDDNQHVINFLSEIRLHESLMNVGEHFKVAALTHRTYKKTLSFPNILMLLKSLQNIGATALPSRKKGLMSRQKLMQLSDAFPRSKQDNSLILTYHVAEICVIK